MLTHVKSLLRYILETSSRSLPSIQTAVPPFTIGQSVNGRDIVAYTFGHGSKHVMIVGGIHGNEIGTMQTAYSLINWFMTQPQWHQHLTMHIIPCLNPDGYAQALQHPDPWHGGMVGRLNANGVDLNRNFPTKDFQSNAWRNFGKNYSQRLPEFAGEHAGSEPEIQATIQFITKHNISLFIALHNRGGDIGTSQDPAAQTLGRLWAQSTHYKINSEAELRALGQTGNAKTWCEEHHIIHIEIEERYRWCSDFEYCRVAYAALLAAITPPPKTTLPL